MVERPFADRRPVGPIMDIDLDRDTGRKIQLGVSGTSFGNIRKSPLNVLYVLDTHVATLPKDTNGMLATKIRDKVVNAEDDSDVRLKVKRSGISSMAPFDEQALVVSLQSGALPIQETEINRIANTIESHYDFTDVGVQNIIFDTE